MKPRIAFYGDDFTGSADVMEVLQWAGIPTVLFMAPPNAEILQQFDRFEAVGVAGHSRAMSPEAMQKELRPVLRQLRDSGAELVHYKTCSTFDSSPEIGSIGQAIEIGRELFGPSMIPVVIGAPNLGRYQVFGNLFAKSGLDSQTYRLDRHPTMTAHPITPMNEADLRLHLHRQTDLRIGLIDVLQLDSDDDACLADVLATDCDALLFDVLYPEHLSRIGGILAAMADQQSPRFVVGSSGVEYALTQFWQQANQHGLVADEANKRPVPSFEPVEQLLVLTGSCSPVNDRQITWAEQNGFESLALDPARLIDGSTSQSELETTIQRALQTLACGSNLILHTARGPQDPRISLMTDVMRSMGMTEPEMRLRSGELLGPKLGQILKRILNERSFSRVGVAGGDTSGFIARELELVALEAVAPVAPGSPLCRAHANNSLDGVEFFFKGGQVGKDDVWRTMLSGTK